MIRLFCAWAIWFRVLPFIQLFFSSMGSSTQM